MALVDVEGLSYVEQVGSRRTLRIAPGARSDRLCASCPRRGSNPATTALSTVVDRQGF